MIQINDNEFNTLVDYVKQRYGVNLFNKRVLVESRLNKVLAIKNIATFQDYINIIMSDRAGTELTELMDTLTTNVTYFMREPQHFEFFKNHALPWMKKVSKNKDLRIWSAGCSSGEEPYTLSMFIDDQFLDAGPGWDKKVLATDISERVLGIAKTAIYIKDDLKDLPPLWIQKYFTSLQDGRYELKSIIKNNVVFGKFNLMEEVFPFKEKFHVIFCRNVMIYFDNNTKDRLVKKFYDNLVPGGFLFIGHSESINREKSGFKYILPALYCKE